MEKSAGAIEPEISTYKMALLNYSVNKFEYTCMEEFIIITKIAT